LSDGNAWEHGIYLNSEQSFLNNRLSLAYGIRTSLFQITGPGRQYEYDKTDSRQWVVSDTIFFEKGRIHDNLFGWEPRVSLRLTLNPASSLKASYNRMIQHIQQAQSAQSVAPYDVWYMTSNNIPPQVANQAALGYFRNLLADRIETSLELYYKDMNNVSDVIDNGDILGNEHFESQLRVGDGWSYGMEALIRKETGPLSGFIGYTWARSRRKIEVSMKGKHTTLSMTGSMT
jgi:hypothetical protein